MLGKNVQRNIETEWKTEILILQLWLLQGYIFIYSCKHISVYKYTIYVHICTHIWLHLYMYRQCVWFTRAAVPLEDWAKLIPVTYNHFWVVLTWTGRYQQCIILSLSNSVEQFFPFDEQEFLCKSCKRIPNLTPIHCAPSEWHIKARQVTVVAADAGALCGWLNVCFHDISQPAVFVLVCLIFKTAPSISVVACLFCLRPHFDMTRHFSQTYSSSFWLTED